MVSVGEGQQLSRTVLPVVSMPITVGPHDAGTQDTAAKPQDDDAEEEVDTRLSIQNCRALYLPALQRRILVAEAPGELGESGDGAALPTYLQESGEIDPPRPFSDT